MSSDVTATTFCCGSKCLNVSHFKYLILYYWQQLPLKGTELVTPDPTGLAQSHCAPKWRTGLFRFLSLFICLQTFLGRTPLWIVMAIREKLKSCPLLHSFSHYVMCGIQHSVQNCIQSLGDSVSVYPPLNYWAPTTAASPASPRSPLCGPVLSLSLSHSLTLNTPLYTGFVASIFFFLYMSAAVCVYFFFFYSAFVFDFTFFFPVFLFCFRFGCSYVMLIFCV